MSAYRNELHLPNRILLGPGPSNVHPRVLQAMLTPMLGHLDPDFWPVLDQVRDMLRLVLGTHDVPLIRRITSFGDALGIEREKIEVNMLYGIQAEALVKLAKEGHTARQLIAYGPAWYGWYIRRLAERPANVLFVARQMVG